MAQSAAAQSLMDVLNKQICNFSVLNVKLHNYHWFVTGNHFYELHAKFEEFYTEATAYIDEIAERLLSRGGVPVATMKDFLQHSSLKEATGNETPEQMVQTIADDFTTVIDEVKQGVVVAEELNDDSTADLLIGIRTSLEKHVWMLKAFLK